MTITEYRAAKYTFSQVPETCPEVFAAFDAYMESGHTKADVDSLIEFVTSRTKALRELSLKLAETLIANNIPLPP